MYGASQMGAMMGYAASPLGTSLTPLVRGYEFTLSNGEVTGMEWVNGWRAIDLRIPANASFSVGANASTVTETIAATWATQTIQYAADPNHAGLYYIDAQAVTVANPSTTTPYGTLHGYTFTSANGAITGMQEVYGTRVFNLTLAPTARFSADSAQHTVTETLVRGNTVVTTTYLSPDGGPTYALAAHATDYVFAGASATPLWVQPYDRDMFSFDAAGNITQAHAVRADGSMVLIGPYAAVTFTKLEEVFVVETLNWCWVGRHEVYHDGNGDGIYTSIAQGPGTTVDLVGLQAQLNAAIDAVL